MDGGTAPRLKRNFGLAADAGFLGEVIPILPPGAKLSPRSEVSPTNCGKVPGEHRVASDDWVGMIGWTERTFTTSDIRKWDRFPACNVGLRTAHFPAVDIDCENDLAVSVVRRAVVDVLGRGLVRGREGSERQLILYRLADGEAPATKSKIVFKLPGETYSEPKECPAIEFLGRDRQCVVAGTHPKGGKYYWHNGRNPVTVTAAGMVTITAAQWMEVQQAVRIALEKLGCEIVGVTAGGTDEGERHLIPYEPHVAKDKNELVKALNCIPAKRITYDLWITIAHWYKMGVGGDEDFYPQFAAWSATAEKGDEEGARVKWDSVTSAQHGADSLFALARQHGYEGAPDELTEITEAPADEEAARANIPVRIAVQGEHQAAIDAERRLRARGVQIFQYNSMLTEIAAMKQRGIRCEETTVIGIQRLTRDALMGLYSQHLQPFERWNPRAKNPGWEVAPSTENVAKIYLARPSMWGLPVLTGITNVPTLRPDGTILNVPGYDDATGLLYDPNGTEIFAVTAATTLEEAKAGLAVIKDELLCGFPFATEADRSVALSFILSSVARKCFAHAPAHLFSAPKAGSGKGKLVNIASIIATGSVAPATDFSGSDEELRKTVEAQLMQGSATLNLDNVERPVGGRRICSIVTEDTISARILGQSRTVDVVCSMLISANGNNIRIKGDMRRRALLCYIDPKDANPENRSFDFDPIERAKEGRGRYLAAALAPLAAFIAQGCPGAQELTPWGSFGDWSALIRGTLVWCGEADPVDTVGALKADDAEDDALSAVHAAWAQAIGIGEPVTMRELIAKAETAFEPVNADEPSPQYNLREALLRVAGDRASRIDGKALGYWMRSIKNTMSAEGFRIVEAERTRTNDRRYKIEKLR